VQRRILIASQSKLSGTWLAQGGVHFGYQILSFSQYVSNTVLALGHHSCQLNFGT